MIFTFDQAFTNASRTSASSFLFTRVVSLTISSHSFKKRRYPVVDDEPRSKPRVVMATFQPLLTPPTTLFFGQRALVKKISLNSAEPSTWVIGRTSTPSWRIGTKR